MRTIQNFGVLVFSPIVFDAQLIFLSGHLMVFPVFENQCKGRIFLKFYKKFLLLFYNSGQVSEFYLVHKLVDQKHLLSITTTSQTQQKPVTGFGWFIGDLKNVQKEPNKLHSW